MVHPETAPADAHKFLRQQPRKAIEIAAIDGHWDTLDSTPLLPVGWDTVSKTKAAIDSWVAVYREEKVSETLIDTLRQKSCYLHEVKTIDVIESDLAWIVLTGNFAYKIKKPIDLYFLNNNRSWSWSYWQLVLDCDYCGGGATEVQ